MPRSYDVSAEFYDLLQATDFLATAQRLLDRWLGAPRVGVLDVGAGTGIATGLLARRVGVTVHAVEPSASMRAVLLSRLAGRPELLSHVRVHTGPIQRLGLHGAVDFALCLNTLSSMDAVARASALAALARATVPGGRLVVQRPPSDLGLARYDLPAWQLGGDTYTGEVTCVQTSADGVQWRFAYRVIRAETIIRTEIETFDGHLVSVDTFAAELATAGFSPIDADTPDIVIARRDS
jgi:SAM-dependent methyltransferase